MKIQRKTKDLCIVIRGGGELASATALRLFQRGFKVIILELLQPKAERMIVSFANAVYKSKWKIENVTAQKITKVSKKEYNFIPVIVDPLARQIKKLKPDILIDARMLKKTPDTFLDQADLVIGLGPGFKVGKNCHYVVETKPGGLVGKIYVKGKALPDTGRPCEIEGLSFERIVYSPVTGVFKTQKKIGNKVKRGDILGFIGKRELTAKIDGVIRGILKSGLRVKKQNKLIEINPREINLAVISDRAHKVSQGVIKIIDKWVKKR